MYDRRLARYTYYSSILSDLNSVDAMQWPKCTKCALNSGMVANGNIEPCMS